MDPVKPSETPESIGPYRLEDVLGRGGMGEVYRAVDQRLKRRVAIKHIRPEATLKRTILERFRREASIVARLSHPAIVQIFDVVENEAGYWIVMEFIDGPTLTAMTAKGPLDLDLALSYGRQVAEGLAEAHAKGILHRDLKTENVMVTPSGHAKILDFGLAKRLDKESGEHSLTVRGEIMGTGRSMSPEQARGLDLDARSDLFSLGVLLYELLTGRPPFRGRTMLDTLTQVVSSHQAPVIEVVPSMPKAVSDLVDRLLEKAPELRPQSARQVALDLEEMRLRHASGATNLEPSRLPSYAAASTHVSEPSPIQSTGGDLPEADAVVRTLVVSDLVGGDHLFEELGDRRALEIGKRHDGLARRLLGAHNGREIDKGDGFLLIFRRPIDAVAWALDYHHDLKALSEELGHTIAARVGIHLGEVFLRENPPSDVARGAKPLEVEGLAKSMAAHVMSLAVGGQTLMSRGAYDLAHRASQSGTGELDEDTEWLRHGAYRVEGLSEAVEIFEAGSPGTAPMRPPEGERVASGAMPVADDFTEDTRLSSANTRRMRAFWILVACAFAIGIAFLWLPKIGSRQEPQMATSNSETALGARPTRELIAQGFDALQAYDRRGSLDKAIASFTAATTKASDSALAYAGLARALWRRFDFENTEPVWLDRAVAAANRAVEIDPFLVEARVSRAFVRISRGETEGAKADLEFARSLEPGSSSIHIGLGLLAERAGRLQDAIINYRDATERDPSDKFAWIYLGSAQFRLVDLSEAAKSFETVIELDPESIVARRNLSVVYYLSDRPDDAKEQLQTALRIDPQPGLYANLGSILFAEGLYSEAVGAFEQALRTEAAANNYRMWANLGDAYRWAGQKAESETSYVRALQLLEKNQGSPDDIVLISRRLLYEAKLGKCRSTTTFLDESVPQTADAYTCLRLATAAEVCGLRIPAVELLQRALNAGLPASEVDLDPEFDQLRKSLTYHQMMLSRH